MDGEAKIRSRRENHGASACGSGGIDRRVHAGGIQPVAGAGCAIAAHIEKERSAFPVEWLIGQPLGARSWQPGQRGDILSKLRR